MESMGATLHGSSCHFRTWAPNASRVMVIGSFNGWNDGSHPLQQEPDGIWALTVEGVHAGDEYLYVIDNRGGDEFNPGHQGMRRIDPWARATRHASGNGVVVDVVAELSTSGLADDPFRTPQGAGWLIYQAHVGSFGGYGDGIDTGPTGTATFAQFEQKLPYIRSLGFNAIALLPIHQNPGDGNEGYAPAHLFSPESSFGTPLELRHLVRSAHDLGLAVIFDVVWNHMSDVDNRLWEFDGMTREGGIFYEDAGRTPWGPRLATWKGEVRDFVVANAVMCLEEYHVDGLRIDAANEIGRQVLVAVVDRVREDPRWHDTLLVVEWTGDVRQLQPPLHAEHHFDRVWALTDPQLFGAAVDIKSREDVAERVDALLELISLPEAETRVRYLVGSHDNAHDNLAGDRTGFRHFVELAGGRENPVARAKARMGWALSVVLPGTPMCFMGTECHQPGYWHPRPDANPTHKDHRFDWQRCNDSIGQSMRALVADTNWQWWEFAALRQADLTLVHVDRDNGVLAFCRPGHDEPTVLVVVNLGDASWIEQGYAVPMQDGASSWRVILDTQDPHYGGNAPNHTSPLEVREGQLDLRLSPWCVLLLASIS